MKHQSEGIIRFYEYFISPFNRKINKTNIHINELILKIGKLQTLN